MSFGDGVLKVKALDYYDFKGTDIVLMSAGGVVSKQWAPKIAAQGAIVIDNSSAWRMDRDVPLIVPEVNADALAGGFKKGIVANPNCSTIQLVVVLKPLHDAAKIKRVVVSTYQSVSGAGKDAMDEAVPPDPRRVRRRSGGDRALHQADRLQRHSPYRRFPRLRPDQGRVEDDGRDAENPRSRHPAHRDLRARAGVHRPFRGGDHRVRGGRSPPTAPARSCAPRRASWWSDKREDGGYVTPIECAGEDATFVSRIRKDPTVEHGLSLWIVADNLRKGAALNAVQIAEALINRKLLKRAA